MQRMAEIDMFADYPNLQSLKNKVVNIPQIKKWIEKRPADVYWSVIVSKATRVDVE